MGYKGASPKPPGDGQGRRMANLLTKGGAALQSDRGPSLSAGSRHPEEARPQDNIMSGYL